MIIIYSSSLIVSALSISIYVNSQLVLFVSVFYFLMFLGISMSRESMSTVQ